MMDDSHRLSMRWTGMWLIRRVLMNTYKQTDTQGCNESALAHTDDRMSHSKRGHDSQKHQADIDHDFNAAKVFAETAGGVFHETFTAHGHYIGFYLQHHTEGLDETADGEKCKRAGIGLGVMPRKRYILMSRKAEKSREGDLHHDLHIVTACSDATEKPELSGYEQHVENESGHSESKAEC